jgi:hypothetical protein
MGLESGPCYVADDLPDSGIFLGAQWPDRKTCRFIILRLNLTLEQVI